MSARSISGLNWVLDGGTITVRMPIAWKRRGGRKVIVAPIGGDAAGKTAAGRDPDPSARTGASVEAEEVSVGR